MLSKYCNTTLCLWPESEFLTKSHVTKCSRVAAFQQCLRHVRVNVRSY